METQDRPGDRTADRCRPDLWASSVWKRITASGLLEEDDTAVIYYSTDRLRDRLGQLRDAFGAYSCVHTVAIKTNPQRHILEQIVQAGFGLEAASFEEVQMAVAAGAPFDRITYNSPVKTHREIAYCEANYPGLRLNVNSLEELDRIGADTSLNIGLRINPLVHAGSQDLYNVSGAESKFGVSIDQRQAIIDHVTRYPINTLHLHVGSQVGDIDKVVDAIAAVVELADFLTGMHDDGEGSGPIEYINIGGGIPAGADEQESLQTMQSYVEMIQRRVPALGTGRYRLITEFGQWVHKHNGLVFSSIEYVKKLSNKSIAYVHVGADLFLREAYTGLQALDFVCLDAGGALSDVVSDPTDHAATASEAAVGKELYDIAGPLCFNGDYLGKDRLLPRLEPGDIIAMPATGANSYGLWSRHCSRTVPAILTDADGDREGARGITKVASRFAY